MIEAIKQRLKALVELSIAPLHKGGVIVEWDTEEAGIPLVVTMTIEEAAP